MISNQILQTNIEGLKGITRVDLCICDTEGKVLASTFTGAEEYESAILAFVDSPADSQVIQGYQFFKVFDDHQLEYILLAKGGSDDVYMVGKMAAFQVQNLLVAYKRRFDKDNFIRTCCLTICFWLTFITVRRSCTSRRTSSGSYLSLRRSMRRM